jgi:pheromone shutdown protein TraB
MIQCQKLDPPHILLFLLVLLPQFLIPGCRSLSTPPTSPLQPLYSQGLLVQAHSNLYVLGTVHLGSTSAHDAQLVVETLQPSKVIVELPPSRLQRSMGMAVAENKTTTSITNLRQALGTFPALASAGLTIAGVSGMLVTIGILWSSLVKRSLSSQEENKLLPRRNEFEAAIATSDSLGADVLPADWEFEELVERISTAMTTAAWIQLALTVVRERLGLKESDPISRKQGESMVDWEHRRRRIDTARASRVYSQGTTPELHQVLVSDRDEEFAQLCVEAIEENDDRPILCIAGLVHVDGIVNISRKRLANGKGTYVDLV